MRYIILLTKSVGLSFEQPLESIESTIKGTLAILETIKTIDRPIKFIMLVQVSAMEILIPYLQTKIQILTL